MVNQATRAVDWNALGWERRRPRLLSKVLQHELRYKITFSQSQLGRRGRLRSQPKPASERDSLDRPECTPHELLFQINISLIARD